MNSSTSIERRLQFRAPTRSSFWIHVSRTTCSSSLLCFFLLYWAYCSFHQVVFDIASTPARPLIGHWSPRPGTTSSILFSKHVSFVYSIGSSRPVITSRRVEDINNQKKFFSSQSTISPLHPACMTSAGTVCVPTLMTRAASHGLSCVTLVTNYKFKRSSKSMWKSIGLCPHRFISCPAVSESSITLGRLNLTFFIA